MTRVSLTSQSHITRGQQLLRGLLIILKLSHTVIFFSTWWRNGISSYTGAEDPSDTTSQKDLSYGRGQRGPKTLTRTGAG